MQSLTAVSSGYPLWHARRESVKHANEIWLTVRDRALRYRCQMEIETALLEAVAAGDVRAWQTLLVRATPLIDQRARSHPQMRRRFKNLKQPDCDYVHDVRELVFQRLASQQHRNIKNYLASAPGLPGASFAAWLTNLTAYAVREYLTRKYGPARGSEPGGLHRRDVGSNAAPLDCEDAALARAFTLSTLLSGRKLLDYARRSFSESECAALELYLVGHSYEEIDGALGLGGATEAERTIRKLKQRLREVADAGTQASMRS